MTQNFPNRKISGIKIRILLSLLIFVSISFVTINFINSPKQGDINDWIQWIQFTNDYGLKGGYLVSNDIYPPIASEFLYFSSIFSHDLTIGIKLSLFIFLIISSEIFYLWNKNLLLASSIMLVLGLNTILGYIDIYIVPTFILSFRALNKKNYILFSVLYTITCLIEWQPIILLPFILIYFFNFNSFSELKKYVLWRNLLKKIILPSICVFAVFSSIYHSEILKSLLRATEDNLLSKQALNLNWIFTYFLHLFFPHKFGPLINGYSSYFATQDIRVMLLTKLAFGIFYFIILYAFTKKTKTFKNLVLYSLTGYLTYFIFFTGVHENYLFPASVLSLILLSISWKYHLPAFSIILADNLNLFLFHWNDLAVLPFNRVTGVDITVVFAFIYFVSFVFILLTLLNLLPVKINNLIRKSITG